MNLTIKIIAWSIICFSPIGFYFLILPNFIEFTQLAGGVIIFCWACDQIEKPHLMSLDETNKDWDKKIKKNERR